MRPFERFLLEHQAPVDAFQLFDLLFDVGQLSGDVVDGSCVLEPIALATPLEDMRRLGSKVLGRLSVDALTLVAAMVDPFLASVLA